MSAACSSTPRQRPAASAAPTGTRTAAQVDHDRPGGAASGERPVDQELGAAAGHEHAGRHRDPQPAELRPARHVLERLAGDPAADHRLELGGRRAAAAISSRASSSAKTHPAARSRPTTSASPGGGETSVRLALSAPGHATRGGEPDAVAGSCGPVVRPGGAARSCPRQSGSTGMARPGSRPQQHGPGHRRGRRTVARRRPARRRARARLGALERQLELHGVVVVQVADRDADQREAPLADHRHRGRASRAAAGGQDGIGVARSAGPACAERVARVKSSKRSRSITVRPTRVGRPHPPGHPVDQADQRRRRSRPASAGAPARARAASRSSRAAPADLHRPRVAVVGQRVQVPAGGRAEHGRPGPASPSRGHLRRPW